MVSKPILSYTYTLRVFELEMPCAESGTATSRAKKFGRIGQQLTEMFGKPSKRKAQLAGGVSETNAKHVPPPKQTKMAVAAKVAGARNHADARGQYG